MTNAAKNLRFEIIIEFFVRKILNILFRNTNGFIPSFYGVIFYLTMKINKLIYLIIFIFKTKDGFQLSSPHISQTQSNTMRIVQ